MAAMSHAEVGDLLRDVAAATEPPEQLADEMGLDADDLRSVALSIRNAKNSTEDSRLLFALEVGFRIGCRHG